MNRLRLSKAATTDLRQIQEDGIARFGVETALRHMAGFTRVFMLLREHAFAGPERVELGIGVRTFLHKPHRVIYRLESDIVVISSIVHASQVEIDGLN